MIILRRRPPSKFFPDFRKIQKASQILGNLGTCSQISEISIEKVIVALNNGSLVIGDTLLNYGGCDVWNGGDAAGLTLECNSNTEIAVHDNGTRFASCLYYEGDANNKITIGLDMGWSAIKL